VGFEGLGRAGPTLSESPDCWRKAPASRAEGARPLDQLVWGHYYSGRPNQRGNVAGKDNS